MIERLYRCDLCDASYSPDSGKLFGLHWGQNNKLAVLKSPRNVEHHICVACFTAIQQTGIAAEVSLMPQEAVPRTRKSCDCPAAPGERCLLSPVECATRAAGGGRE